VLNAIWFKDHPAKWLLFPFAVIFALLSAVRRLLFAVGIKKQIHPGIPVIIVGNISVGGNGKTPVVTEVAKWLVAAGYQPGVLSRGFGGTCQVFPHLVVAKDTANDVGDEPRLMASRLPCPVVIDPKRPRGAALLKRLGCDVIVCDDGLQHYALARDIEWVVMDDRKAGNGALLPMGPLRESVKRLLTVDAVIHNGKSPLMASSHPMTLQPGMIRNVVNAEKCLSVEEFKQRYSKEVTALAGIGDPQRFFTTLQSMGIATDKCVPFPDHHRFVEGDIPAGPCIMTEKDAVKCTTLAHQDCWYLEVSAQLPARLRDQLLAKLTEITSN